jgi:protein-disulfide isomerase
MSKKAARESAAARAAAVLAEQQRAESRRRLFIVGGVVLVVLLIVGVGFAIQSSRDTTGGNAATPTGSASATASASDTGGDTGKYAVAAADTYGLGLGNPSAKVKIEIFEDFLCPYCNEYEHAGRDQLRQDVADGKAYVVYRPIAFLNEYSVRALNAFAVVLEKSGPDVALKFHDLLYDNQPEESGAMPNNDWLIQQAVAAGAKEAEIRPGIEKESFKQWVVNGVDEASKRGVNSTPTVFANGTALSGSSIDDLVTKTDEAIESGQ